MEKRFQVIVQQNWSSTTIECTEQETILEAMIRQGLSFRSDCGGRGTCGKCRIKIVIGELAITTSDLAAFSEEELLLGYRLACKALPSGNITISLYEYKDTDMRVVTESNYNLSEGDLYKEDLTKGDLSKIDLFKESLSKIDLLGTVEEGYAIGIDLGTTTLAIRLIDRVDGRILTTYTQVNPQRVYGADVVSRMRASKEGKLEQLRDIIRGSLSEGIISVIRVVGIEASQLKQIVIAGNTTMIHLLMGYSCETLGVYPFLPVNINTITLKFKDLFFQDLKRVNKYNDLSEGENNLLQLLHELPVIILPGISTFVGGDIVAGLAVCGYHTSDEICLLIDLGTNGEIAIGNRERILVTSTAAGPAFEGGNISCGVGSIPGAICRVNLESDHITLETIGEQKPIGICGTGAIELASELFRNGVIDETGLLREEYLGTGYPIVENEEVSMHFTQKDIRELQLAKAAVRAGIEVLLKRYGVNYQQIGKVYLAGGFGFYLDIDKAIKISLLPEEFRDKIFLIGNSSLAGVVQYASNVDFAKRVEDILVKSEEIHLSNDEDFNELYLEYMYF